MLGYFNPNVDQILIKPSKWVDILNDIFNPKFGFAFFRVYRVLQECVLKLMGFLVKRLK